MTVDPLPSVHADDEWSPLKSVIVGRAGAACFPNAPKQMIEGTMPPAYHDQFKPQNPFPKHIVAKAEEELDHFSNLLEAEGIKVYRPPKGIDWQAKGGYTGAMPRDGLMSVKNTLIEACFAWSCRSEEIEVGFGPILKELASDRRVNIVRRPQSSFADTLHEQEAGKGDSSDRNGDDGYDPQNWAINNSRPAFDTADFMRFGKTIIGQYSHVTNRAGIEYIQQHLPPGYTIEVLDVSDPHAMHIDATILPLREGLLVYHPEKVTEASLRKHAVLKDWDLRPYPVVPSERENPPLFMTSPWLCLNALVIGDKVVVEAGDQVTIDWYESLGMKCIPCPFQHVNSLGGSFHCATVDLVRG